MGCFCSSETDAKSILKKSVLGLIIFDSEHESFLTSCKIERHNPNLSLTKSIHLNNNVIFYLILEGEISATISHFNKINHHIIKSTVVRKYKAGDIIHLCSTSLVTSDGVIIHKELKLDFTYESSIAFAIFDQDSRKSFIENFQDIDGTNNIESFRKFCDIRIHELFFDNSFLKGIKPEQVMIFSSFFILIFVFNFSI